MGTTLGGGHEGFPEIRTERLLLRGWCEEDLAPFAALNADPRVMEHFVERPSRDDSDAFVGRIGEMWLERGFSLWALERLDTGGFIGFTGLYPVRFDESFTPAVEVGWRLAAEHWGRGFAPEAARAALRYGFEVLELPEIVSFTAVHNLNSWRVMEKIGLRRDAEHDFEHPRVPEGHPVRPHVLYRLTREEWLAREATEAGATGAGATDAAATDAAAAAGVGR